MYILLSLLLAAPRPAATPDGKNWKVEAPHGPSKTVRFTTDEGTWLHVDVHPDGQRLVFSLLGDLYLLPLAGGAATRITSGPAYDMEPRFSPDGRRIAFTSDRSGIESIWTCDLQGKQPLLVAADKESTVSAPAWSPDGEWILGRKRITDLSSLGTIELWMWHVKGGKGVQVTKGGEQPAVADPTFAPAGRFIYFSSRDQRYRYARNVNEGIWQIKRWDRRTGQDLAITGEFGGAAAPAISPDGKTLAFVRRVRARTRLELMDLATGKTRVLADGLQRDEQEGFAAHGVFPGYDWTPDGTALVITSEGKLWRYDATTGARTAIPFEAQVEQRVDAAARTPRRLGGDTVRARILRWPVESPDGKTLVFSALGHLYSMDLPAGTPARVTSAADLEYAPAFSPDGREIAYVTWNDRQGGHVYRRPAGGGDPVRLTTAPSQYANPSYSADGKRVVFVKGSGASFRDNDLSDELWHEIHWVETGGGEPQYVIGTQNRGTTRHMPRPTFSADGTRIYFVEDEKAEKPTQAPKTVLVSVKLDGTDKRKHLRFTRAEDAVASPDGRWVAFQEQHDIWVAPMPEVGDAAIEVGLEEGALPVGRLTREGGDWVSWAQGGKVVTWISGPTYHRLELDKAVPAPTPKPDEDKKDEKKDGEGERPKPPKSETVEITLNVPRARPAGVVAYTGARVVTMKGDEVLEHGTIVVDGDRITAVGKDVAPPSGARVVDLAGKTVIPGLFDEHAHLHYSTLDIFPQRPWKYEANLAYGVTATHDVSATTDEALGQGEMVEAGLMTGPRIYSTGFILYGADHPRRAIIKSLDDARQHLRRMKSLGAFSVKSYMQPKREQRQWILQAAREEGMLVVPEGGGDLEMDMTMILDGHTTLEHALPIAPLYKDVISLFAGSGTAYTPTLLVAYGGIFGDRWFLQHQEIWKDERLARHVPQGVIDVAGRIRTILATEDDWHHDDVARSAKALSDAGVWVNLGGHGQMQGLGPHWELQAFVQGGMTPLEALRAGTLNPARTLGLEADLGSLEPGKLADFVALDRNPLEKIENSTSVALVVKNGVAYRPEDLARPLAGR